MGAYYHVLQYSYKVKSKKSGIQMEEITHGSYGVYERINVWDTIPKFIQEGLLLVLEVRRHCWAQQRLGLKPKCLAKLSTSSTSTTTATAHPRRRPSQRVAPSVRVSFLVVSQLPPPLSWERRFAWGCHRRRIRPTQAYILPSNHRQYYVCRPCPIEASVVIIIAGAERVIHRLTDHLRVVPLVLQHIGSTDCLHTIIDNDCKSTKSSTRPASAKGLSRRVLWNRCK